MKQLPAGERNLRGSHNPEGEKKQTRIPAYQHGQNLSCMHVEVPSLDSTKTKCTSDQSNFTLIDSQLPNSQVITELFMHSMDVFILCLSAFAGEMKDFAALIFRGFMHWKKTDSQTWQSFCRHFIKSKKFTNRADTESDGGKDGLKQAKVVRDH